MGLDPALRHAEFCSATKAEFESLTKMQPPNVTSKQWRYVVFWTLEAHRNCITIDRDISQADRDRFLAQLRQRARGQVQLTTIDWIWDELARLTRHGKNFLNHFRPTRPQRLLEFEECHNALIDDESID